jgi:putative membrane protein
MIPATIKKNDKQARLLIGVFSFMVFAVIVSLGKLPKLDIDLGFDVHVFAIINAITNSLVAILLVLAMVAVKQKKYIRHKKLMMGAMYLSIVFLVSYIAHHLFAGETKFGGTGTIRYIYFFILATHIVLAAVILPFILFTAYRGLTGEFEAHRKLAKYTWPLWLYVAVTGPIVYLMISPYYQ